MSMTMIMDAQQEDNDRECPDCGERMCDGLIFNTEVEEFEDIRICGNCRPGEHGRLCVEEHMPVTARDSV